MSLREDAKKIIDFSIEMVKPTQVVKRALLSVPPHDGKTVLVAIGKAGYEMIKAAAEELSDGFDQGICITKYGHVKGTIDRITCCEAGHPVLDENTITATKKVLELVSDLSKEDLVIFLVSGGGSALFEVPLLPLSDLQDINDQLLKSGASITEINTIRKRLSAVKGGRFAQKCAPAHVYSIVLSDIVGDPLDMIASGPAYPDLSTCTEALAIAEKYSLNLSDDARKLLETETPKELTNITTKVLGSVKELCEAAAVKARNLGYEPVVVTSAYEKEAVEAGRILSELSKKHAGEGRKMAFILGGESVVKVKGSGLGGRNQEIALSAANGIDGLSNVCIFSLGSDGTDGPTDAAGGIVFGNTKDILRKKGVFIKDVLENNDSYNALKECDGLIITGPTGTNVNDVAVALIQ